MSPRSSRPQPTIPVPVHLARQLLKRDDAHAKLLAAYRLGTRPAGGTIDALGQTRLAPRLLRELLEREEQPFGDDDPQEVA